VASKLINEACNRAHPEHLLGVPLQVVHTRTFALKGQPRPIDSLSCAMTLARRTHMYHGGTRLSPATVGGQILEWHRITVSNVYKVTDGSIAANAIFPITRNG
jgi:hypothetical protein